MEKKRHHILNEMLLEEEFTKEEKAQLVLDLYGAGDITMSEVMFQLKKVGVLQEDQDRQSIKNRFRKRLIQENVI